MVGHSIHQLIDFRQRIAVLWACLVQIGQVPTHSPSPVRFHDEHHVRDPFGILALSNETRLQQLLHLRGRHSGLHSAHVSSLLDHWLVRGVYF